MTCISDNNELFPYIYMAWSNRTNLTHIKKTNNFPKIEAKQNGFFSALLQ